MDRFIAKLPQLIIGTGILLTAVALGLGLVWLIRTIFNRAFAKPDFKNKFSRALLDSVMFVPGWIIILLGCQIAIDVFNFKAFPSGMFTAYSKMIFAAGMLLYFAYAWRRQRH